MDPSFDEFNAELKLLLAQKQQSPTGSMYQIKMVRDKEDLIKNFREGHTSLVLSLEGAHNLHGDMISKNDALNRKTKLFEQYELDEYLRNVDSIKHLSNRVFFVTLGHFTWNGVVGSAKTLDMEKFRWLLMLKSKNKGFRRKLFYKPGDGILGYVYDTDIQGKKRLLNKGQRHLTKDQISIQKERIRQEKGIKKPKRCDCVREILAKQDLGWKTIDKLLDTAGGIAPIFIDVKHMDIKARFQYYHYVDSLKKNYDRRIPIIASHVAASGEDTALGNYSGLCPVYDVYQEVGNTRKWYKEQYLKKCLNVSDERKYTVDWFYPWSINLSDEEIPIIYNSDGIIGITLEERVIGSGRPNYKKDKRKLIRFMKLKGVASSKINVFNMMQPLFRNMFYFVEKSGKSDATAWDHLSIGSDFDGIVKPMKFCKTAAEIPKLHSLLIEFLPYFTERENKAALTYGLTSKEIADKVVFENGERFMLKYF